MVLSPPRTAERVDAPHVTVTTGLGAGASLPARDGLTLGRHPLNDLCLRDPGIAARHAVLRRGAQGWLLEDLSGEGLLVEGQRLGEVALGVGTEVQLGPVRVCLHAAAPEPAPSPAVQTRTITAALPTRDPRATGFVESTELNAASLESVIALEAAMGEEQDFDRLVGQLADWMAATVPAQYCAVLLREAPGRMRTHSRRMQDGTPPSEASCSVIKQAVAQRVGVLILDAPQDDRVRHGQSIIINQIRSAVCVPLLAHGEVLGVLYAATSGVSAQFDESHLRTLSLVAGPTASALRSARLVQQLSETNRDLLRRLAICARFNDDDTGFHIQRVGDYAALVAHAMGESSEYCGLLRVAAPMHDIGKIGIPQAILQKPGKLTPEEWTQMQRHAEIGEQILGGSSAPLIQLASELAGSHHEKWDGSGYPRGLAGPAIPLSGRLVAVADVFDALTTQRCYKPAFSIDKARSILLEGSGHHFDPGVIEAFFSVFDQVLEIRQHYAAREQAEERGAHDPSGS